MQLSSIWNGYDLTKKEGVQKLKQLIATLRPCHVWISCDCGPYSPLQRLNQRSENQIAALEEKRAYARAEYKGGIEVAEFARLHGASIHWELSEKCEAWNLPLVSEFVQRQQLQKVTCHGCAVNLRASDTGELMCKGWTIATSHEGVLKHMHLPCQKNHKKTYCESGRPRQSAFYTPVFAKKVIEAMRFHEPWSLVSSDLQLPASPEPALCHDTGDHVHVASVAVDELPPAEVQRIQKLLRHIHSVSGHGSTQTLARALQKRGVPDHVLELARRFECPICLERKRVAPRRPASLETIPLKWQVVQSDLGSWYHPITKDKCKFIMFIDEGSRFRTGKILFENSRNQATWPIVRQCFEEHWLSHHGQPESIRVDPEGVWRGEEADAYCRESGISLTPIPAEAHWQVGVVENAIKAVKYVMTSLAEEFKDMTMQELFSRALWACNSRDNQHGYSPLQHATGRAPDEWGRLFESKLQHHPIHPQQMIDGGFAENIKAMSIAEQSFARFKAEARIARATAAGSRPMKSFCPGDLVYYWRRQVPLSEGTRGGFSWSGQFVGPARVLAVETKEDEAGNLRPGSCVWLHRAGRLIRAAPEQLRPASDREIAMESLKGPIEIPWTITSLATHPTRRTYVDVSSDLPTNEEYVDASQHPTERRRFTSKRKGPLEDRSHGDGPRSRTEGMDMDLTAEQTAQASFDDIIPGVEITIELPDSKRGIQKFIENPEAFVVSQLRRKTVEVQERKLTRAEVEQFNEAKQKEIRSFLQAQCFKVVPDHMLPPNSSAIGMRWLLTWKSLQDGTNDKKAKARAVIIGYQDKSYEHKQTASPTLSRVGRQAFLMFCAQMHFRIQKGDVSAAFLQGDQLENDMWVVPTKEICHALGVPEGTTTKLQRAAYGLVEAPLWWYKSVSKFLESLGYTRLKSEPCIWVYFDADNKPRSIISGHVDDFLFGGASHDEVHLKLMAAIQAKFAWGQWENTPFVQCGVRVSQREDFGFDLEQCDFVNNLKPIFLSRDRERMRSSSTTDSEKTQLRAVLGSLSWLCGQTDFVHSSDVGFLISTVPHSTVQDIVKVNQLIHEIKRDPVKLTIHGVAKGAPLDLAWADAAWANRPDNSSSTGGLVIAAAPPGLRKGELVGVNLLSWRSYKIDRSSRSPACAETHAVVDGEDELYHVRIIFDPDMQSARRRKSIGRVCRAMVTLQLCALSSRAGHHQDALEEALKAVLEAEEVWSAMHNGTTMEVSSSWSPNLVSRALAALVQAKHCVAIELEYNLAEKTKSLGQEVPEADMIREQMIPALHREASALARRLPSSSALRRLSERTQAQEASRRGSELEDSVDVLPIAGSAWEESGMPSIHLESLRWFSADTAYNSLHAYAVGLAEPPLYHVVDIFGGSQRVAQAFRREGMTGISFDVKLSPSHDLTSEALHKRCGDSRTAMFSLQLRLRLCPQEDKGECARRFGQLEGVPAAVMDGDAGAGRVPASVMGSPAGADRAEAAGRFLAANSGRGDSARVPASVMGSQTGADRKSFCRDSGLRSSGSTSAAELLRETGDGERDMGNPPPLLAIQDASAADENQTGQCPDEQPAPKLRRLGPIQESSFQALEDESSSSQTENAPDEKKKSELA
eukprot:s2415_g4.t1